MIIIILAVIIGALGFISLALYSGKYIIPSIATSILTLAVAMASPFIYTNLNVYVKEAEGRAQLAQATYNRRIQVEEAQSHRDSAKMLAEAEILRAQGVSEANRIVADGLGGAEGYLRYLYIEGLKQAKNSGATIIYVPTEAGLPILEAGRVK